MAASATEWSHDFCLSCDKQTTDGAYCSQACRLADLEKAGGSEPASPLSYASSVSASSYGSTGSAAGSGFYLSPALNFSAYRNTPPSPRSSTQSTYFQQSSQYAPSHDRQTNRSLATSSSRASLSSISSSSGAQGISDQALTQLRSYVSSFDQTRDMRRRMTYS